MAEGGCPVGAGGGGKAGATKAAYDPAINDVAVEERPARFPGQRGDLGVERVVSSIPRAKAGGAGAAAAGCPHQQGQATTAAEEPVGCPVAASSSSEPSSASASASVSSSSSSSSSTDGPLPAHQPADADNWVYPSEQQYFNAMKRKGFNPDEKDVPMVLAIHNQVNEEGWRKVQEWEEMRNNTEPKLVRFMGRPTDISPKARFRHWFMGFKLPFDRHDWYVDRNGESVRYVIDFYKGREIPNKPVSIYMDVRPALDSPTALFDRLRFGATAVWTKVMEPLFR